MLRCAKIFSVLVSYARAKNADLRLPMSFCPVYGFIPVNLKKRGGLFLAYCVASCSAEIRLLEVA